MTYKFNAIPIKMLAGFYAEMQEMLVSMQADPKIHPETLGTQNSQSKEQKCWTDTPSFQTLLQSYTS